MSISKSRFDAIFNAQSAIVKKVYEAVPIAESWTAKQIVAELLRKGLNHDSRTVTGCIDSLIRSGLVSELIKGEFRREAIKELATKSVSLAATEFLEDMAKKHPNPNKVHAVTEPVVTAVAGRKPSPMDILGDLAARVAGLATLAKLLSDDIGDAAIEIQQHIENSDSDTQKFRQLQSLLKSIG